MRWRVVALVVTVLVVGALVVNARLDPYRVGTTHEVVLDPGSNADACGATWGVHLGNGSTWIPLGRVGDDPPVPIAGTLTITANDRGVFESDPDVGSRMFTMVPGGFALDCTPPT
jgi:hypothetical protein